MKVIKIIGFQGVGKDEAYADEPNMLIKLGHFGVQCPEDDFAIFGFRPTDKASAEAGDAFALEAWLKARKPIAGAIHDDTDTFYQAYQLSLTRDAERLQERLVVYELEIQVSDDEYARIRSQLLLWYTEKREWMYRLPPISADNESVDNCATFPRKLGIRSYIEIHQGWVGTFIDEVLRVHGQRWIPDSERDG